MGAGFKIIDPLVFPEARLELVKALSFVSGNHLIFRDFRLSEGSVVNEPWSNSMDGNPLCATVRRGWDL